MEYGHWMELACFVKQNLKSSLNSEDAKRFLEENDIKFSAADDAFRAYNVIELSRPELLKDVSKIKGTSRAIRSLPNFYKRVDSPEDYDKLIDDVIGGKISYDKMYALYNSPKTIQSTMESVISDAAPDPSYKNSLLANLVEALDLLSSDLLHEPREYERSLRVKCHKVALKLECLADESFYTKLKNQEEFKI